MPPTSVLDAALPLLDLPGVRERATAVSEAAGALRFHEALRRRIPEAAAESRVRGARASAALDGADFPTDLVRELVTGARPWPQDPSPDLATLHGAVTVTSECERLVRTARTAPSQVLARLHVAAMTAVVRADWLGRPRTPGEGCDELTELGPAPAAAAVAQRLAGVADLVSAAGSDARLPAPVVVALAHAEVAAARPFVHGNAMVARGLDRVLWQALGVDSTGVAVPEAGYVQVGATAYLGALTGYVTGSTDGVALWLRTALDAALAAVEQGVEVCDAVRAGRWSG